MTGSTTRGFRQIFVGRLSLVPQGQQQHAASNSRFRDPLEAPFEQPADGGSSRPIQLG